MAHGIAHPSQAGDYQRVFFVVLGRAVVIQLLGLLGVIGIHCYHPQPQTLQPSRQCLPVWPRGFHAQYDIGLTLQLAQSFCLCYNMLETGFAVFKSNGFTHRDAAPIYKTCPMHFLGDVYPTYQRSFRYRLQPLLYPCCPFRLSDCLRFLRFLLRSYRSFILAGGFLFSQISFSRFTGMQK